MRRLILFTAIALSCGCSKPEPLKWTVLESQTGARLQAVDVVDQDVIWVSGTAGTWGMSADAGLSWRFGVVAGADSLELRDVDGLSGEMAFALSAGTGGASRIFRTTDGGDSWQEVFRNPEPDGFFDCMAFWDKQSGIAFSDAVGGDFLVVVTRDGGDTWSRVPADALPDARPGEGSFASSGTCLVVGTSGRAWFGTGASGIDTRVFRTADYGATWAAFGSPIPSESGSSGIFSLVTRNGALTGAFGGEYQRPDSLFGHVALTGDGGRSFTWGGDTGIGGAVYGAATIPGSNSIVAVSPSGTSASMDDGRNWARIDSTDFWAVAGSPDGRAWAVGPSGRVAYLELSASR